MSACGAGGQTASAPAAQAEQPKRFEKYVRLWDGAEAAIADDVRRLDEWLKVPENVDRPVPQDLIQRFGFDDPQPYKTLSSVRNGVQGASVRWSNWRDYATALERLRREWVHVLLLEPGLQRAQDKVRALNQIGREAPHPALLALMRAIAEEPSEPAGPRCGALGVLALTPHAGVVPELIAFLKDEDAEVAFFAFEALWRLTGFNAADHLSKQGGWSRKWADLVPPYEKWWAEHKETFKHDRARLLGPVH